MYKVEIKTKYNVIHLIVENLEDEQFKEVCEQPYVEEIRVETMQIEKKLKM